MADQSAPDMQTCPFCYTELDARATVCSLCQAEKDILPSWFERGKVIFLGCALAFMGLGTVFVGTGSGPSMWGIPLLIFSALIFIWAWRMDISETLWRRKK